MIINQRQNKLYRPFAFFVLALIFLSGCNSVASTPISKPNSENIKFIGHIAESNQTVFKSDKRSFAQGLEVANNIAYIAVPICINDTDDAARYSCNENWLRVIDMSDPTKPTEIGVYISPIDMITDIAVSGNYAYITSSTIHGLTVWDISNRLTPTKISSYEQLLKKGYISSDVYSVTVEKDNAYVAVQQCKATGDCIYEQWILDVSEPQSPTEVQIREIAEHEAFNPQDFQDVIMTDDYMFIARGNDGLSIVDKSEPKKSEIGYYNTPAGVWSVAIGNKTDGLFYIADYNGGVYVLQLVKNAE